MLTASPLIPSSYSLNESGGTDQTPALKNRKFPKEDYHEVGVVEHYDKITGEPYEGRFLAFFPRI
jgi:hypothetical protein